MAETKTVHTPTGTDKREGFFDTEPADKPTVTGSTAANAALQNLLVALEGLGLIVDNTTA